MVDYITKKFPRHLVGRLRRVKARMELNGTKKVTEGEVFALALIKLEESIQRPPKYRLLDLAGSIKFRKKISPKDIDKIVYGV